MDFKKKIKERYVILGLDVKGSLIKTYAYPREWERGRGETIDNRKAVGMHKAHSDVD